MTKVKICGIQEAQDALAAAHAGAEFIGLVFVPGRRRRVDDDRARRIVTTLKESGRTPPRVVGLFADQALTEVNLTVRRCGLDMVQLCGSESLDYCAQIAVPVIKVLHVTDSPPSEEADALLSGNMLALRERGHLATLDRRVEGLQGGTGVSFNWEIAKALSVKGHPFLLAGGLTTENVADAVRIVRPWGVDVSSGVETDGAKDVRKIRAFIQAVRVVSPTEPCGEG